MRALIVLAGVCGIAAAADAPSISGDWRGTVTFKGVDQHLAVHLKSAGSAWTGWMDAIDSGVKGIPLASIAAADGKVAFSIPNIGGKFGGVFDAKTGIIVGTWSQDGLNLSLSLHRPSAVEASRPRRPQEPTEPFPYLSEEVAYDNPQAAGVRLAGAFTRPKSGGPFHAVLLITGSGPQNRDEELMDHKPFLVLADYLTRRGVAVLRVDDRGIGESTGDFKTATTQDFASDAMAGVRYLASRPDVDRKHIGLIGHSEGGIIAPMVAVKMPEVAFIVMLAGTGVTGAEVIEDQVYQANLLGGMSPEMAATPRAFEHKLLSALMSNDPDGKLQELSRGDPAALQRLKVQMTPWYRYFLAYDPRPALEQIRCPVLALNGSKDSQVTPELNLPAIEAALKKAGNRDFTVQLMPGVNHLFQKAKTGSISEYREIEETMSPQVLEIIAAWVARH